ncbi:hypothetical protein CEXT_413901 [Caerostris extrusa]|uniref:Uncharacterized protein n=1 Tax=Caerostris extrusa TaxID=172846 RepID=A0AAV4TRN9_CAEEX|nr:hypothetical protein CEXT_413901 [Caerostris extrusa]
MTNFEICRLLTKHQREIKIDECGSKMRFMETELFLSFPHITGRQTTQTPTTCLVGFRKGDCSPECSQMVITRIKQLKLETYEARQVIELLAVR